MSVTLREHQIKALKQMHNGCILCGGTGSGKSITSLGYYYICNGGDIESLNGGEYVSMKDTNIKDLYIITTAKKRDSHEWELELARYLLSTDANKNPYSNTIVIDSWNNIQKYKNVTNAFFIFDEQRVVGDGAWAKAFIKIAKTNEWILLSATPGDTWSDYMAVFIANGFYKNKTEFTREHVIYDRFSKYPKIDRYIETGRLLRLRKNILIDMPYAKPAELHHEDVYLDYDILAYKELMRNRWNEKKGEPIKNASELCYELRRIVNSDNSRILKLADILESKKKLIVFYNYDYELDTIKSAFAEHVSESFAVGELNGHKHQDIPNTASWLYLVQYSAGAEAWNCIKTDTIVFYSQSYSYKMTSQASGRIDRLNTPYKDLYYYHFKSRSSIDLAIAKALATKKKFNELKFVNG